MRLDWICAALLAKGVLAAPADQVARADTPPPVTTDTAELMELMEFLGGWELQPGEQISSRLELLDPPSPTPTSLAREEHRD